MVNLKRQGREKHMQQKIDLAVIGGSGLYSMSGLTDSQEVNLDTPFGKPSAPIIVGVLGGKRVAFLARHGMGHHILPGEVNYRANIYALKSLGVDRIVSVNACGSLREDFSPGHMVIPDQIFDITRGRPHTFFGSGLVAHVGVADPFCPSLSDDLESSIKKTGTTVHRGGTFLIIEGPRFSTRAESQTFRSWGMSIIGMTAAPEAFLAREAEICYTVMAHVTDYDVWHADEAPVTVEMVVQVLIRNTNAAQKSIHNLVHKLSPERHCECGSALNNAIITNPNAIQSGTRKKLDLLVKKYLP